MDITLNNEMINRESTNTKLWFTVDEKEISNLCVTDYIRSRFSPGTQINKENISFGSITDWCQELLIQSVIEIQNNFGLENVQLDVSTQVPKDKFCIDSLKCFLPDGTLKAPHLASHFKKQCSYVQQDNTAFKKEAKLKINICKRGFDSQESFKKRLIGRTKSCSSAIRFFQWLVLFGLCCHASGTMVEKMSMSVDRIHATFNKPIVISCIFERATKCSQPAWLYGTNVNNELLWKTIATKSTHFTNQYIPSLYNNSYEVTYKMTILELQPHDVLAWLRCECDTHTNITKRLLQIDDKLTVYPEVFYSTIEMFKTEFNITTTLCNVYPEPRYCTLSIDQMPVLPYDRTYCTLVRKPDLLNATYMGFFDIPSKPCNQTVTVTCYIGDRPISRSYLLYDRDRNDTCKKITSSSIAVTVVVIILLGVFIFLLGILIRFIRKKRQALRQKSNDQADLTDNQPNLTNDQQEQVIYKEDPNNDSTEENYITEDTKWINSPLHTQK